MKIISSARVSRGLGLYDRLPLKTQIMEKIIMKLRPKKITSHKKQLQV